MALRRRRAHVARLSVAAILLTIGLAGAPRPLPARAGAAPRPNFVLILTDDQSFDSLAPGAPVVMPALEARLADPDDHWIRFSNFFFNTPLCCPTRATILTGQYSHVHGVEDNSEGGNLDEDCTIATWLDAAGYRTALVGKYLNGYPFSRGPYIPPGWDSWFAKADKQDRYYDYSMNVDGTLVDYGSEDADYSTAVERDRAISFLRSTPVNQPFLLTLAISAPHSPWTPAPGDEKAFKGVPMPHSPAFNEADVSDKPAWVRDQPLFDQITIDREDRHRRSQYATLLGVDDAVDSIVRELQARGVLDTTMIVFMTDNGFAFGEHRWEGKRCEYDECLRSPFLVRFPGAIPGPDPHLVSSVDVAPTIADLAGATPDIPMDGTSLAPLLRGGTPAWRDSMLIEHEQDQSEPVPGYRGVRTTRYLYTELDTGERELYDTAADPYQLQNRAGQQAYAAVQAQLAADLRRLLGADLSVTAEASPTTVPLNGSVTVTADVKNLGPGDASGVAADVPAPAGMEVTSATSTLGSCDRSVHCMIGALPSGAKATITIVATGTQAGTRTATASVSGAQPDPASGNDIATATVTVQPAPVADLSLTLADSPDPVPVGDALTYTARISNTGPNAAQSVRFSDPLPAGLTVVGVKPGAKCGQSGATVSCSFGSVPAGGTSTVVVTVRPAAAGSVTNTASVTSTTSDPDAGDRTATATTTVAGGGTVDLRLTGSAAPNPVRVNEDLTYRWRIADQGSAPATGVTFTHRLPAETTLLSLRPGTKCAASGANVTCTFRRIDPGSPVTVTEIVRPTSPGTLSTTAQVTGSEPDGDPGDEAATVTVAVSSSRVPPRLLAGRV